MLRPLLIGGFLLCAACVCSRDESKDDAGGSGSGLDVTPLAQGFTLSPEIARADLAVYAAAPHPFGSPRQAEIIAWLETRIKEAGAMATRDPFTAETPNPAVTSDSGGPMALTVTAAGANLVASGTVRDDAPCVVALGTHFDTKIVEGLSYVGANDGGSSTVVLIQQLAYLKSQRAKLGGVVCDVIGIFFDGEEAVLKEWTDGQLRHPAKIQDNTYGSRSLASRLTDCAYEGKKAKCLPASLGGKPLVALVLMDMIGSPDIVISREKYSTAALVALAEKGAKSLGSPDVYGRDPHGIEDDHIPFLKAGVPAIDLIDFNHVRTWHGPGDDPASISMESLAIAGKLALFTALSVASEPKVFTPASE